MESTVDRGHKKIFNGFRTHFFTSRSAGRDAKASDTVRASVKERSVTWSMRNPTPPLPFTVLYSVGPRLCEHWDTKDTVKDPLWSRQERNVHEKSDFCHRNLSRRFRAFWFCPCAVFQEVWGSHCASHSKDFEGRFSTKLSVAAALQKFKDEPRILQGLGTGSFSSRGKEGTAGQEERIGNWRRNTSHPCHFRGSIGSRILNGPIYFSYMPHSSTETIALTSLTRNPNICPCFRSCPWKQKLWSSPKYRVTSTLLMANLTTMVVRTSHYLVECWR